MLQLVDLDYRILCRDSNELIALPKIIRVSDFEEGAVREFAANMSDAHATGQPVIPIVIDSGGGDVYALWAMVDIIERAQLPIATIVEGKAMSCGAVLFTCGAPGMRFMGPNATLMIHEVSTYGAGGKASELEADTDESKRLNNKIYNFMDTRIGKRKGYLQKLAKNKGNADWYLDPQEALKLNFANHIRIPVWKTTISVSMELDF